MNAPTHACAICRKPASSVCAGCAEGTDIASINHTPARYCNEECQKTDWPSHSAPVKFFRNAFWPPGQRLLTYVPVVLSVRETVQFTSTISGQTESAHFCWT